MVSTWRTQVNKLSSVVFLHVRNSGKRARYPSLHGTLATLTKKGKNQERTNTQTESAGGDTNTEVQ